MPFVALIPLVFVPLLSISSATPLSVRSTCFPNFEGAPVSIHAGNGYVDPFINNAPGGGSPDPVWYIHQNGQPNPGYFIKVASNTNLAMTWNWLFDSIVLTQVSDSGLNPLQQFDIECQSCFSGAASAPAGTVVGSDCIIKPRGVPTQCLQTAPRSPSSLFPEPCGSHTGLETFAFAT
ncbi:hypothetical protein Moror_9215 [Moniliophthora roreri MCA 2997]|uniref:Uncharacterized protein n=1 Tax=Moniliophthora roreri (strain MCA 2997) TaxID=1381753 RepID=V2WDQ6_MONRO|nr:hypothetical protein Moror_9215 [Moniliophthora roreri MCA 2997]